MNREVKRILVIVAGIVFIVLGLVGLALPFLQGFLFLLIGLILLSISSTRVRVWLRVHTVRYPKVHAALEKMEVWVVRIIGKVDGNDTPKSEN